MSNNKEIARFSLFAKKECIENILTRPGDITRDVIVLMLDDINRQMDSCKKRVSTTPRKLSPYNYFVKAKIPELSKQFPEMDNRTRMSRVSELWKNLSPTEKESFKQ